MNDFGESRELFQLRSGRVILDEDMWKGARMFVAIKKDSCLGACTVGPGIYQTLRHLRFF